MLIAILFCVFITVGLVSYALLPTAFNRMTAEGERRKEKLSNTMEQLMPRQEAKRLGQMFIFVPLVLGLVLFFILPEPIRLFGVVTGVVVGFIIPGIYVRILKQRQQDKFGDQLVDSLMIMSSSFRGGLSLVQAIEAVVEEMPDPINKEFATVLGENKMGVSLEDALYHLYNRMPSAALQQMITAILLARETGGNLPVIFNRIVNNIRENKKIRQNIDTLTIQGKIQGVVLSILPVAFAGIVYSSNRQIFENMIYSETGKALLMYSAVSWLIGIFLIWRISTFREF